MLHVICPNIFTLKENDFVLYYHTHGQYVCDQQLHFMQCECRPHSNILNMGKQKTCHWCHKHISTHSPIHKSLTIKTIPALSNYDV